MNGRTSQHSPTALIIGDAQDATRLQAGDQDATQYGPQPRTRKTGYTLLLAAEALPPAFLAEDAGDVLTYTEPGDLDVQQAVQDLRLAVTRYNVCWCSAPEQLAGDLYRLWVAPTPELLATNRMLPLFFTEAELQAALAIVPAPRRPLRPPSLSVQTAPQAAVADPLAEQSAPPASASAQPTPPVGKPERIEVFASLKTITWAFSTLQRRADEARLPFRLRQLWLLRAALQAVQLDQQLLDDLPGVADKLRRVLVCRRQVRPGRIKIEPCYEDGQLVGCELLVAVPPALVYATLIGGQDEPL
jgi:hypothetical protein